MTEKMHVMLSYQWNHQETVSKVYDRLTASNIPCWMDIKGGMSGSINDAMAEGVENAFAICSFMTEAYQKSANCKKELQYAESCGVLIVPVMMQNEWKASGWLGITTAGMLWQDFRSDGKFEKGVESLVSELKKRCRELIDKQLETETRIENKTENVPEFKIDLAPGIHRIFTGDKKKVLACLPGKSKELRSGIVCEEFNHTVQRQNITAISVGIGQVALRMKDDNFVLEVDQGDEKGRFSGMFHHNEHDRISIMTWQGIPAQRWNTRHLGDDRYVLFCQGSPGFCLEACGDGQVKLMKYQNGNQGQIFWMKHASPANNLDFDFKSASGLIKTHGKSIILTIEGKGVIVDGLTSARGKTMHDWPFPVFVPSMFVAMQWKLKKNGTDFVIFMDNKKKQDLGQDERFVWDAIPDYKQHQKVHLWNIHNGPNQCWNLEHKGDGWYRFVSKGNREFCLDAVKEECGMWDGTGQFHRVKISRKHDGIGHESQLFYLAGCEVWDDHNQSLGYMRPELL